MRGKGVCPLLYSAKKKFGGRDVRGGGGNGNNGGEWNEAEWR